MLTARGEVMDRVIGLELGADDYLSKPFEPRELVARIHNVFRRTQPHPEATVVSNDKLLQFSRLHIDDDRHIVDHHFVSDFDWLGGQSACR